MEGSPRRGKPSRGFCPSQPTGAGLDHRAERGREGRPGAAERTEVRNREGQGQGKSPLLGRERRLGNPARGGAGAALTGSPRPQNAEPRKLDFRSELIE